MADQTQNPTPGILVVEDENAVRTALVRFLGKRFGRATGACNLNEARRYLADGEFDALVVDLGLPDGSGLDLIDAGRCARTLVISAVLDLERIRAAGVQEFLPKPIRLTDLEAGLRRIASTLDLAPDREAP